MALNRTLDRSFKILELIKQSNNGLSLKEISDQMNIPKTSAFDIVQSLVSIGILEKLDDDVKRYTIGIKLFALGSSYVARKNIYNISNKYIKMLAEKLNKTAFIGVENEGKIIYIQKYEPKVTIKTSCDVGSSSDLYSTALGKSILAFSSEPQRQRMLSQIVYRKEQRNTITDEESLIKDILITKKRGYAIDNQENKANVFCLAAPIFNQNGDVVASISASGIYKEDIDIAYESQAVMEIARLISKELGYL